MSSVRFEGKSYCSVHPPGSLVVMPQPLTLVSSSIPAIRRIIQSATEGVIAGHCQAELAVEVVPLCWFIGLLELNVPWVIANIAPRLDVTAVAVKVKLEAATSAESAIFQCKDEPESLSPTVSCLKSVQLAGDVNAPTVPFLSCPIIWANIKSPTVKPTGFTITTDVEFAPGL